MTPTMVAFLRVADPPTVRATGRALLVLSALLEAAGRNDDAGVTLADGCALLEHAAGLRAAGRGGGIVV
jgi:hypothetical protein